MRRLKDGSKKWQPGRGKRRRTDLDPRTLGWNAPVRTKVSENAEKGFAYEVRLWRVSWHGDESSFNDLFAQMRLTTDCRVLGTRLGKVGRRFGKSYSPRVLLRTEADLFQMRMLCDRVFRVYRLIAPETAAA